MKKLTIIIGVAIILILASLFIFHGKSTGLATNSTNQPANNTKEFTINAFRFGFSPDTITVKQGDDVKITINNADGPHGMIIPDLGIQGVDSIEFIAKTPGEYIWYCEIPCGPGHREMQGKLIITK